MLVGSLVSRSLRILCVTDPNEAPEAERMAGAIVALNGMMNRWEANGISLGWSDVGNPADILPAPVEAEEAIAFNLALALRSEYAAALEPDVIKMASDGLSMLRRDVFNTSAILLAIDTPRSGGSWDIRTDSLGGNFG